ncbi:DUF6153 family protein [Streptomyces sp. P9(2023)]|uniref:DUF6153 family protein n=1 Tax=Streptomyces sp. P9(2023) TaxID=3064394 RepID=UPI0028F43E7B|nr:DUF6153 family protein [Streptomyces sp. P9(2023)]MDT9691870.1 DUF6153 family protein [Streptomyces sp. P9(2023)]
MRADKKRAVPPKWMRVHGLLVLAVLIGLLGMHAMGPVPAIAQPSGSNQPAAVMLDATGHCDHDCSGHEGQGHHADPACASAAVGASVSLPALQPTVICPDEPTAGLATTHTFAADRGRAPLSLSELQLLRI